MAGLLAVPAHAQEEAADVLIKRLSVEVLDSIKADPTLRSGDVSRVVTLVDSKLMPNMNFKRMTAAAVGPTWRQVSTEQQKRVQEEFKILLVRTYAGAVAQANRSGSACLNSFTPRDKETAGGLNRCRVVHGGVRRLRRTQSRGGQLGAHQGFSF